MKFTRHSLLTLLIFVGLLLGLIAAETPVA
jgi:hypothetical protein